MSKKYRMSEDPELIADTPVNSEALELPPIADYPEAILSEPPKSLDPVLPVVPPEYLSLRIFATIAGPKWDQMAGFVSHARHMKFEAMTMEAWQAEFKKFQDKPVG